MNDRIKQHAIIAGLISAEYNGFDSTKLTEAQKKFAELIIQDCVNICMTTTSKSYLNGVAAGTKIRLHFGV